MTKSDQRWPFDMRILVSASALAGSIVIGAVPGAFAWYDIGGALSGSDNALLVEAQTSVDEMSAGMADAYVRGIQDELVAHGYRPGATDGIPGRRTRAAIRTYQRDAGLPVTGDASKELLDHLKFVLPKVNARPALAGPSRRLVGDVQRRLSVRGYYVADIDGLLGPATRDAVRHFQSDAGLPVTGAVDQRLLAELEIADTSLRRD